MSFAAKRRSDDQKSHLILGSVLAQVLMSVIVLLTPGLAMAAEWKTNAGLRIGEAYTDNVGLDDSDKEGEFITTVTPDLSLEGKGARANIKLLGVVEFNDVGGDADSYNPQLQADADVELIKDFFFVEGDASARQTAIDPFSASGDTSLNERDNKTTTYQYGVSPYISARLKSFAVAQLRYRYDDQINRGEEVDDSTRESANFSLNSGPDFTKITWGFLGNWSKTNFDDQSGEVSATESSDNELISATLRLGYRINRKWQLTTSYGKEWNDFISNRDTDDKTWTLGLVWTPTSRTKLDVDYGERFFGKTPALKFTHKHKHSTIKVNYLRELTDSRSIRQQQIPLSDLDIFDQLVDAFGDSVLEQSIILTTPVNVTLVNEQFDVSYSLKGKRTTIDIKGYQSKQIREDLVSTESTFNRFSISADRKLSSRLSANGRISWDERENEQSEKADTYRYSLGLTQKIGPNTNLSCNYTFSQRDSDLIDDDYDENKINLSIRHNF